MKKDEKVEVANEKKGKKVKDLRVLDPKSAMNLCKYRSVLVFICMYLLM